MPNENESMPITPATKAEEVSNRPSLLEQSISLREYIDVSVSAVWEAIRRTNSDVSDVDRLCRERQDTVNSASMERNAEVHKALAMAMDSVDGRITLSITASMGPVEEKFNGYNKAIELLQARSDSQPPVVTVASAVDHLRELTEAQIANVKILIDKTGELNNTALQAAFAAAKEAVGAAQIASATANTKMETNFTKQLDATGLLISTMEKALNGKIEDVKSQVITSMPRVEVMAAFNSVTERVTAIEKTLANYQGALLMVGLLSAAIPTIVVVLLHFMH